MGEKNTLDVTSRQRRERNVWPRWNDWQSVRGRYGIWRNPRKWKRGGNFWKWGLKVGERITIPPIYRNVRPPIGRYCAVEKNYSQWGVIAIDGTMMIEPQYSDIEISMKGDVTGTKVSGNKVLVKLP